MMKVKLKIPTVLNVMETQVQAAKCNTHVSTGADFNCHAYAINTDKTAFTRTGTATYKRLDSDSDRRFPPFCSKALIPSYFFALRVQHKLSTKVLLIVKFDSLARYSDIICYS